jgi:hypothetical protein
MAKELNSNIRDELMTEKGKKPSQNFFFQVFILLCGFLCLPTFFPMVVNLGNSMQEYLSAFSTVYSMLFPGYFVAAFLLSVVIARPPRRISLSNSIILIIVLDVLYYFIRSQQIVDGWEGLAIFYFGVLGVIVLLISLAIVFSLKNWEQRRRNISPLYIIGIPVVVTLLKYVFFLLWG